jgi:hypothetical protein|nr:MAG TPA: hypothetical protein [Caudoviricetes sp.]
MKYYPPLDNQDNPDASYTNGSEQDGVHGSYPDARGFEAVMREIVNTIIASGDTPNGEDNTQLASSIQRIVDGGVRYQSLYQRLRTVDGGVLLAEDEKIINWAELTADTTFTIDMSQTTKKSDTDVVTFELYVNMPTPVVIVWPEGIQWPDGEAPDVSEPGLYLLTFRYIYKEAIWQASLNAGFTPLVRS